MKGNEEEKEGAAWMAGNPILPEPAYTALQDSSKIRAHIRTRKSHIITKKGLSNVKIQTSNII
jgi:hypothetical protein